MMVIERRIGLLFAGFLALIAIAAVRATWFGAIQGPTLRKAAATQQVAEVPVPAQRGTITDRTGVELAVSSMATTVAATPYLIKDPVAVAKRLAPLLGKDEKTLLAKLTTRKTGFVYLARKVPGQRVAALQQTKVEGLQLIPETRRSYPRGWMASQLIGTVGTDGHGLSGLEYARERALHGSDGDRRLVNDALGQPISLRDVHPARAGEDLKLTLDASIQAETESVLAGVGEKYQPHGATAVVMDPRDGSILAMANWPRVDANDVAAAPPYARQNRAVAFTYEPGSTFKAITVAGALQDGIVKPDTSFNLAPQIVVADRTIGESHPRGYETLTTAQILAQSSNIGAITIGLREGKDRFAKWVDRFGFGKPSGVDVPGEEKGVVLPADKYSGSTMGNVPIGQGEAVTPIQMATAYSAIANGGILRPAHVIDQIGNDRTRTPRGERVISPSTAASLRRMLEGVLAPGGTASEAAIPGYKLAGKTGTANKPDPVYGGYSTTRYVASFVGFAPARHPRLLVSVMVDEPKGAIYGGVVAAPAFQKIMSFALPYLRIPPS